MYTVIFSCFFQSKYILYAMQIYLFWVFLRQGVSSLEFDSKVNEDCLLIEF